MESRRINFRFTRGNYRRFRCAGRINRLALQIAKAGTKARMTQGQLAKAVGTTQSVISRIERAKQNLTIKTLSKIAVTLHTALTIRLRPTP